MALASASKQVASSSNLSCTVGSCGCPNSVTSEAVHITQCPVCLAKFDSDVRLPIGLRCGHTLCKKCVRRLYPDVYNNSGLLDGSAGLANTPLLQYLEYPTENVPLSTFFHQNERGYIGGKASLDPDCIASMLTMAEIAKLLKSHIVSRAIHRKVLNLLTSLSASGELRLCRAARAVGDRTLMELTASCSHLSHYHAQKQLWAAIRARACQFMGPAMQEEALKLVLLALEDGSALSRKVLVMFVVQRLAPQFPQASKTSIGHVIQLLYRASCFDVTKRADASSLMTLRPEYRNYESLRREHDAQIVRIALDAGIRFSPEQWSSILYGDTSHKPHMQSIIDKLQAPQNFAQMTTEFLVTIQRLGETEDSNFLLSLHPHFQTLSSIELQNDNPPSWTFVRQALEAVHCVLIGLVSFNPKPNGRNYHRSATNAPPNHSSEKMEKGHHDSFEKINGITPSVNVSSPAKTKTSKPKEMRANVEPLMVSSNESTGEEDDEVDQIESLLAESRKLREKMKSLQGKIPEAESRQIEGEVKVLEEEAAAMINREVKVLEEKALKMIKRAGIR